MRYFDLEGVENLTSNKNFHTLGGFITSQKGEIPKVKDEVRVGDLLLEVVDMDQFRVDKVMVSRVEESSLGEM